MKKHFYLVLFLFINYLGFSQLTPPAQLQAYYKDVDFTQTGLTLFNDLAIETAVKHTNYLTYSPGIWEASKITDQDPLNTSNVLLIYGYNDTDANFITDRSRNKNNNGGNQGTDWNREHTFPNSLGNPKLETSGRNVPPYADAHNLRPSDVKMNSNRGNLKFAAGSGNAGNTGANWYPGDEWKGDAARILMYMYLRYGDQCKPAFASVGTTNAVDPDMINLLLEWNASDPVSTTEDNRNTYHANTTNAYAQGNRNPFIDNPYLATVIWGGAPAENRWGSSGPSDTEAPTTPTNLAASNPTETTVDLSWTASTDNTAVITYNVYVDGAYYVSTNSTTTTITIKNLSSSTTYSFSVLAADLANNTSPLSTAVNETTLAASSGSINACAFETFEGMEANNSSYADRSWAGNGGQWTAKRARTDQTLNNRAICIDVRGTKDGALTSPEIANGIGELTISTQRAFSGGTGNLDIIVNSVLKGTIPYSDATQTTTLKDINVAGNVIIEISESTSGGDRVIIDDLSWTCYSTLSVDENISEKFKITPNPINGAFLNIKTNEKANYTIHDMLGKVLLTGSVNQFKQTLNVSSLNKGTYILRIDSPSGNFTKKLIK
ncbi:hypothetical protein A8C32_17480 [Flavivirga aquatica]|uniref:Fibronectin type-III domain-containing protein n=1 Tax=Flavivirga aquatica TaxID=1849968 RepID=A0A1E5T881_9FLAO|nr:endonuclease [Flavivirga aquatica]OEK07589.1 hypothetical protein A8C32_17480 [Flavivirga aquatica]